MTEATDQTLEQRRASHALQRVQKHAKKKDSVGNFGSYAHSLGPTILNAGLGQALAFEMAKVKKDRGHALLAEDLASWLLSHEAPPQSYTCSGAATPAKLMACITGQDPHSYFVAQAEALAYITWLKQFATALLASSDDSAPGPATETS